MKHASKRFNKKPKKKNRSDASAEKQGLFSLEQRIVFDAAAPAAISEFSEASTTPSDFVAPDADPVSDFVAALNEPDLVETSDAKNEVVFIDASVEDARQFMPAIDSRADVILLDPAGDGVLQIADYLSSRSQVDAVHIISNGSESTLELGTAKLDPNDLTASHEAALTVWDNVLDDSATIQFYGSEFGTGETGATAIDALADVTGAEVNRSVQPATDEEKSPSVVSAIASDDLATTEKSTDLSIAAVDKEAVAIDYSRSAVDLRSEVPLVVGDSDTLEAEALPTEPALALEEEALRGAPATALIVAEDSSHTFTAEDIDAGNDWTEVAITSLSIPSGGSLTLDGVAVSLNETITRAQIDAGDLVFTPAANDYGTDYASIGFEANAPTTSVDIMAGDASYWTLTGGGLAPANARIADTNLFGPTGTVPTSINVIGTSTTIDAAYLAQGEIYFDGYVPQGNLSTAELTAIDTWVHDGGVMISTNDSAAYDAVSNHFGLPIGGSATSTWAIADDTNSIINGPFGSVGSTGDTFQASGTISYFAPAGLQPGDVVVAHDNGYPDRPTIVLRAHGDGWILFMSDEGPLRANSSAGTGMATANDFLSGNIFAWAIEQSEKPTVSSSVIFDVTPVNDAPVAKDDSFKVVEDRVTSFNPLLNDNDIESDVYLTEFTQPELGNIELAVGESGSLKVNSEGVTVELKNHYTNPVVFVFTTSENSDEHLPDIARVTKVSGDSFQLAIVEPNSGNPLDETDGKHDYESVSFMVLEAGTWTLADGTVVEVGTREIGSNAEELSQVDFNHEFKSDPAVLSQVQTDNTGVKYNEARQAKISTTGYAVTNEPSDYQSRVDFTGTPESIGYLAIETGTGTWNGMKFEAGTTKTNITHDQRLLEFTEDLGSEVNFIGQLGTWMGGDNAHLDGNNLDGKGIVLSVQEDATEDADYDHTQENASWVALGGSGILTATSGTNYSIAAEDVEFVYTPADDVHGVSTSFFYKILDADGAEDKATVTLDITPEADTVTDKVKTLEDTSKTFNVFANDNFEGPVKLIDVTGANNGTVSFTAAGNVTYTPNPDFNGTETLTYKVSEDNVGALETGTITLTIEAVADEPTIGYVFDGDNIIYSMDSDDAMPTEQISGDIVFQRDHTDHGMSLMSYAVPGEPNEVLVWTTSDSIDIYINGAVYGSPHTADTDLHRVSFTFDSTLSSDNLLVYLDGDLIGTHNVSSGPLEAGGAVVFGQEQDAVLSGLVKDEAFDGTLFSANVHKGILTASEIANNSAGNGDVISLDFSRLSTFEATGDSGGAIEVFKRADVKFPSTLVDYEASLEDNSPFELNLRASLTDLDGSENLTTVVSAIPVGVTILDGAGNEFTSELGETSVDVSDWKLEKITLKPVADSDADVTLTITAKSKEASNGDTASVTSKATFIIKAVADKPDLTTSDETIEQDTVIDLSDNLSGELSDRDGSESLSFKISDIPSGSVLTISDGSGGTTTLVPLSGSITITEAQAASLKFLPPEGFYGKITLNVVAIATESATGEQVETTSAESGVGKIVLTITNPPPTVTTPIADRSDTDATGITLDTSTAFNDPDGDTLTYSVTGLPTGLAINATTGVISGTIDNSASQSGPYSVTVTADDGEGGKVSDTFEWTVTNPGPTADNDTATTSEDTLVSGDVSTNDNDVDGDALTYTKTSDPSNGSVSFNANGTFTFTPAANFNGSDSFTYEVSDSEGGVDKATVTITVTAVNDAPVAGVVANQTDKDGTAITPVTVSSSDVEGDTVTYSATGLPTGLTIDASTGVISGTIDNSASTNSPYSVEVTVSDGTSTGTVSFSWTVNNPAPIGVDESFETTEDTAVSGNVLTNDSDPDGDVLVVETTLVAEPEHGSVTMAANGEFTYTPEANFSGSDKFAYRLSDGEGGFHTATVNISVDAVVDAPLIGYEFDGSDIIYAKDGANEFPTEQFTIDLMYQRDNSTDSRALFSYAVPGSNNEVVIWPTENYVALFINGSRLRITAAADTDVHRFTFTYDATQTKNNLKAYMDGELIATRDIKTGAIDSGGALVFGQDQDDILTHFESGQSFKGTLYSADIYSTVLTDQQVADDSAGNGDTVSIDFSRMNNFEVVGDPTTTFQMFTRGTVADPTTIETFNATLEDSDTITMDLRANLTDTDGSETLKTVVSAIPVGVTLDDGNGNSFTSVTGITSVDVSSWTLENIVLVPVADSDADITLSITATSIESSTNAAASVSSDVTFIIKAVADKPDLTTSNETSDQGTVIDLSDNLAGTLADTDGSESLSYQISNLPSGSILRVSDGSGGTTTLVPIAGVATLTEAQRSTLQFLPPSGFEGTITLDVTAVATEGATGNQVDTATANSDVGQIVLTIVNPAPTVVAPIVDRSDADAAAITLDTSTAFNDPDGDTLTYSVSGLPVGLFINATTGVISGTIDNSASQAGPYNVVVTADDGEGGTVDDSFVWTITNPAPTVTAPTADQAGVDDTAISLDTSAAFNDVDADTLTYSVSGLPAGLSINTSTGIISGTIDNSASQTGPYTVAVTADDGEGGTVTDEFNWVITNPAPTVTVPTPDQTGADDTAVSLDTSTAFNDLDSDTLTYSVSGLPSGLSLDTATGVISGTIDNSASQAGPYTIVVTANDGEGGAVSDTFNWTITNPAPTVTAPTADQTDADNTVVTLDTSDAFGDVDADTLTYAASGLPAGLLIDTATGVISGTIDNSASQAGPYTIVVTANDGEGGTVSDSFVWTITNPAPTVIAPTADQPGVDDTAVSLDTSMAFNDVDADTLIYSVSGLPAGLSIDATTGMISGTIDNSASQAGPYNVVVTADDGEGGTVDDSFVWTITNPAPTVTAPTADQAGADDTAVSLDTSAAFNDLDADTLTYSVSGLPAGLSIDATSGLISGTIDNSASVAGPYNVVVTANDGEGGTVDDSFVWTITNPAPTVTAPTADQAGVDDAAISLDTSAAFNDVDADTLTYSVSGLPSGLSMGTATGVISGTIDNSASQTGPYTLEVTADDGEGGTVTDTFIWTITNPAPIAVADSYTTSEDTAVTGNVLTNDSDPDGDDLQAIPTLVTGPTNGSLSMAIDGTFTYTPNPDFNGTDSFTYQVADSEGGFDEASVTINVEAVADAPLIGYEFHGGDILYAEDTGNVFPTDTVSIEMVYQRDNTTNNMGLFSYSAGGQANEFLIYHTGSNVYAYIGGSHTHVGVPADTEIHRLTVTFDGTSTTNNVNFYLDGEHLGTKSLNVGTLSSGGQMVFGQEQDSNLGSFDSGQVFDGTLYSANLYDGILTQQQVETNSAGDGDVISLDFSNMNNTEVQQNASASASAFTRGEVQYATSYSSVITPNEPTTEDFNSIILDLQTSMQSADATETLTTVISAIPIGVSISDGAGNSFTSVAGTTSVDVSSWTLEDVVLTPIADDDSDITLSITATAEEPSNGDTASTTSQVTFVIKAAADKPHLTTSNESISQDTLIDLSDNLTGVLTDTDGSETLSYQISNIPSGAVVQVSDGSGGTTTLSPVAGVVTLSDAQKASLEFLPPSGFYGTITLDVVAIATEGATGDQVETATADSDVGKIVLTITNPPPTVTTPIADQTGLDASVVALDTSTAFNDPDGDTLTYSVTGLPTGLSIDASTGVISGTIDNSASQAGPYSIVVTANDGEGGTVSDTFTWTVANPGPDAANDAVTTAEDTPVTGDVSTNDGDVDGDDLTWSQITNPSNGSVTFNANGTFTYTPDTNFNGTDSFTYSVSDGEGGADTATVSITVSAVNDAPEIGAVANQTHIDGEAITPFTVSSSDVDGDTLTYSAVNLPSGLSIDSASGEISGTIDNSASLNSPWAVEITISDGELTDTASFSWSVTNPAPTADGDSYTSSEDTAVSGNVLSNDTDPDGDDLTTQTTLVTNPANGSVSLAINGTFTYTPANNFHGTDTFTYRMSDGEGGFDEATVTITIDAVNDLPSVVTPIAEQAHVDDQSVSLTTAQAFTDLDGDTLSYSATGLPTGLSIDATTGVISGTVDNSASLTGPYSVTVTASDGNGGAVSDTFGWAIANPSPNVTTLIADQSNNDSDLVTLPIAGSFVDPDSDTLTYAATGLPPGLAIDAATGVISGTTAGNASQGGPAGDGVYTITVEVDDGEGGVTTDTFSWTLSNVPPETSAPLADAAYDDAQSLSINAANAFTNPDHDTLTYAATGLPDSLSIDPTTGIISGTLDNSDSLSSAYSIEVTVSDGQGGTANDTFTLTVNNPGPTVSDPIADLTSHDAETISLSTAGAFNDIDGDDITFAAGGLPAGLSIDPATGVITGTIDNSASQTGPYTITISVDDGEGGTVSDTFTWTVTNPAPVVDAIILDRTGLDNQTITLDVSSAFDDLDADTLTYTVAGLPAGLSIDQNTGIISGTIATSASLEGPASDGQYTVTVTADDGEGGTVADTFVWTISDVAPVVVNPLPNLTHADQQTLSVNTASAFNDPDGDSLTYLASGLPPGLEINSSTGVIFGTIDNSASVTGTFTVIVSVNDGTSSVADTFNWTVTNPAPVVVDALVNQSSVDAETVSINAGTAFSDPDNDVLAYSASGLPAGLTIDSTTGAITGTIDNSASQSGPYTVTVTADDGEGGTATDTFTWEVSNPSPIANNDINVTTEDYSVTGNVLINDSDPDGDALSAITILTQEPSNGTITLSPSGEYTYTPDPDFNGTDTFVYTVSDGEGGTATASVEITVTAINDAPVVSEALENQTNQDSEPVSVNVATAFSDVEGDALSYSATGLPAGLVLDATSGEISGTIDHSASINAPYTVTILASDGNGGAVSTSFIWSVSNPGPEAANDSATTTEDIAISGNLLGNDIDPDGDALSAFTTPVTLPNHGTVSISPDGTFTYMPNLNFNGTDQFSYRITDNEGGYSDATVIVTVVADNDAPVVGVAIPDQVYFDADDVSINVSANFEDADGTPLTYSADTLPPGLSLDPATGIISGVLTSDASVNGLYSVVITATDPEGLAVSDLFEIEVNNRAPVVDSPIADLSTFDSTEMTIDTGSSFTDVDGDILTFTASGLPAGLSIDPQTGVISGTLASDASVNGVGSDGQYEITVTVDDGQGGVFSDEFVLLADNQAPGIDSPIATQGNEEGQSVSLHVANNFANPDNDPLTFSATGLPAGLSIDPVSGLISGTIDSDASQVSGPYQVTIQVDDGQGGVASQTFEWAVTNPAPIAHTEISDKEGYDTQPVSIDTSGFFVDPDADILSYSASGLPNGLTFDPTTGLISGIIDHSASVGGPYTITVTADDGQGGSVSDTFIWTINNLDPTAEDQTMETFEDGAINGSLTSLIDDPDGDALTISLRAPPSNGTVEIHSDGTYVYTPDADFNGTDSFVYQVDDGEGGIATGVMTLNVAAVNDAPITTGTIFDITLEDGQPDVSISTAGIFDDIDGDTLTYSAANLPDGLMIDPDTGEISGTVDGSASQIGAYPIIITVSDGNGGEVSSEFSVTVNNVPPEAFNDTVSVDEDTSITIDVLSNDISPDGDAMNVVVASASNGIVVVNIDGTLTYTPHDDFNGEDTITYTVSDGQGGSSTATVAVSVLPVNDGPFTTGSLPQFNLIDSESGITIDTSVIFSDADHDPLTFTATNLPEGLSIDPQTGVISGSLGSSTSAGGPYAIVITADDGNGGTVTSEFVIAVSNPAPVAVDDANATSEDTAVSGNVLDNDSDPDGDVLVVSTDLVSHPENGIVSLDGSGNYTYTPNNDFAGTDTFVYAVTDSDGTTSTATAVITVTAVNDPPVVTTDVPPQSGNINDTISVSVADSFTDIDSPDLTFDAIGLPPGLTIDPETGQISGTISSLASTDTPYTVTITASDGNGGSVTTEFTWNVINQEPTVPDQNVEITEDGTLSGDGLAGAIDLDGDTLVVVTTPIVQPEHGTVVINGSGAYTYIPDPDFHGTDQFTYQVIDNRGGAVNVTVFIEVASENDAPEQVNTPSGVTAEEGDTVSISVAENFTDADGDTLTFSAEGLPSGLSIDPNTGLISGQVPFNASGDGPYTITIIVDDGNGGTLTATFELNVTPSVQHSFDNSGIETDQNDDDNDSGSNIGQTGIFESGATGIVGKTVNEIAILGLNYDVQADHPVSRVVQEIEQLHQFLNTASTEYGNLIGNWDQSINGFSLQTEIMALDSGTADQSMGHVLVEGFQHERVLYLQITDGLPAINVPDAARYSVTLADGSPLPSWVDYSSQGLVLLHHPVGIDQITLKIEIKLTENVNIEQFISVDILNAQISILDNSDQQNQHSLINDANPSMFAEQTEKEIGSLEKDKLFKAMFE